MERGKKREHRCKYVFCIHICMLHERVLELCNSVPRDISEEKFNV